MYRSSLTSLGCPQCATALTPVQADVALFSCAQCGGAWIDAQESIAVLQGKHDPSEIQRRSTPPLPRTGPERSRPCPRCSEAMLPYPFADVMLDTCPAHGTWFDHAEIERVVKAARRPSNAPLLELPTGADVWATAKFTAGMVVLPVTALVNALVSLSGYVIRRDDDDY
jgi:Zn-finger nucleic acid-binding protein